MLSDLSEVAGGSPSQRRAFTLGATYQAPLTGTASQCVPNSIYLKIRQAKKTSLWVVHNSLQEKNLNELFGQLNTLRWLKS